jgi:glycogen debranching enzyme
VTGRYTEARDHIFAFAACLRHGLIPNLHDSCCNPRYNARDATWWFLQAVQDYTKRVDEGAAIPEQTVPRLFPTDNQKEHQRKYANKSNRPFIMLAEIIQEIMTSHANGIHFVEWNTGGELDEVMLENRFHVDIVSDWRNVFIHDGNENKSRTWMDKMGRSDQAHNRGVPASPRDGAAVEIIGLLESTLKWVQTLYEELEFVVFTKIQLVRLQSLEFTNSDLIN